MKRPLMWLVGVMAFGSGVIPASAVEYRVETSVAAYRWVEDLGSVEIKESGPVFQLGGYVAGSPSRSVPPITLRGEIRLLAGQVDFDTYEQDLITGALTPVQTDSTYLGFTNEGALGWRNLTPDGFVETFVGLGYRWWLRDIGGSSGYPEYYQLIYGRLGLRTESALGQTLKFHGTFSVDPMLWARETIDLTDIRYMDSGFLVEGQRVTVKNGLRPGWTFELGIRQGSVALTGYWQAVRLGESNVVTCFDSVSPAVRQRCLQPKSDQDLFGLRLGFAF